MIKVIITDNNDILHTHLSNIALQYKQKIKIINVPLDKFYFYICQIKAQKNVIILESNTSAKFCMNFLKNAVNRVLNENIIILIVDSNNMRNIINSRNHHSFFSRKRKNLSLANTLNLIFDSINDTLEIERKVDTILWELGFTYYFKGTIYLKDAILLAYTNRDLLFDSQQLVKEISKKNNVLDYKIVRSDMDKALNNMLEFTDMNIIHNLFEKDYDGRKISLKYFINLCIRYLDKQKYLCLNEK